jgi:hypothetical protein
MKESSLGYFVKTVGVPVTSLGFGKPIILVHICNNSLIEHGMGNEFMVKVNWKRKQGWIIMACFVPSMLRALLPVQAGRSRSH